MKHITKILDKVATELESRGLHKLAAEIDTVSNTLDKDASGGSVGVNEFVKRQLQKAHWTHVPSSEDMEKIRKATEAALARGEGEQGYAPFVKLVTLSAAEFPNIKSTIAKITPENKQHLKESETRRTNEEREQAYKVEHFPHESGVEALPADHIVVVLYTKEQLAAEDSNPTGADFDIISINSEPYRENAPIALTTMLRNEAGSGNGGSGHKHSDEEKAKSKEFWNNHAPVGTPPPPRV